MQTVSYRLTIADLVDARSYAYNSLPFVRVVRLAPFIVTVGCLLLGAYRVILQGDRGGMAGLALWFLLGLALIAWRYIGDHWLLASSARKQLTRSKGLQDEIAVSWDPGRITFDTSHGQSRWPWTDLYRWQESSGGLLIWQGAGTYFYLPKRVLAEDQVVQIRASLTGALGKPGKRRKGPTPGPAQAGAPGPGPAPPGPSARPPGG
jgi:hypothetical protein